MKHFIKAIVVWIIGRFLSDYHLKLRPGRSPGYRKVVREITGNTITFNTEGKN